MPDARFPVETIGGVPVVRTPDPHVLRIFAISGLDRVIACHGALGQALALSSPHEASPARCA